MLPPSNIHIGVVVTIVVEVVWIWITIFETIKLHQRPSTTVWLAGLGRGHYWAMTMDVVCSQLCEVFDRLGTLPQIG